MTRVEGYVLDGSNRDIILYGKKVEGRPTVLLDDLCVLAQNVWSPERLYYADRQYPSPSCSLDPQKGAMASLNAALRDLDCRSLESESSRIATMRRLADALGPQQVVIGGVPVDSRIAHSMIDADYHMKKVSQGHISLPGLRSCLEIGLESQIGGVKRDKEAGHFSPSRSSMSRFWFHLQKGHPTFITSSGIVEIENCAMVVWTEKQISAWDGGLMDGGGDDPDAQRFAADLSVLLLKRETAVREYEDLEGLYRVFALMRAIQFTKAEMEVGLDMDAILNHRTQRIPMLATYPALANIRIQTLKSRREKSLYSGVVCGGVNMSVPLETAQFTQTRSHQLQRAMDQILGSRPDSNSPTWTLREL